MAQAEDVLSIHYAAPAAFRNDLETEDAAFFKDRDLSRKGSVALWLKTAVLAEWLIGSYELLGLGAASG